MKRHENGQELRVRMAELFSLPVDLVAGLSHVQLLGDRQLLLEGHAGILSYGTEEIEVSLGDTVLRVRGAGLTLRGMTGEDVRIHGRIDAVEFLRQRRAEA